METDVLMKSIVIDGKSYCVVEKFADFFKKYNTIVPSSNVIRFMDKKHYLDKNQLLLIYSKIKYKDKFHEGTFIEIDGCVMQIGTICVNTHPAYNEFFPHSSNFYGDPLIYSTDDKNTFIRWKLTL